MIDRRTTYGLFLSAKAEQLAERDGITGLQAYYKLKALEQFRGNRRNRVCTFTE